MAAWRALAAVALSLTGCAVNPMSSRYAGMLHGCGDSPATLARMGNSVTFAPSDGVLMLRATIDTDGRISTSLNTQPPGKPPFVLNLTGKVNDDAANIRYTTPRCAAEGTLGRVVEGMF